MKKPIILAIVMVIIISCATVFYYKNIEQVSDMDTENVQQKTKIKEIEKKENWFKKLFSEKEKQPEIKPEENQQEDLSKFNENGKIMVLMYHKFADKSNDVWTRSFSDFKNDLKILYEKNYYPINLSDYINQNIDVPAGKTPVIFTFDDGTSGQFSFERIDGKLEVKKDTAVAIYKEFNSAHPDFPMRGTFYIMSTAFFGATGTPSERLQYLVDLGFEIGNQTKNHYALQNAKSAEKVISEVGGLAKYVDELIPGYVINSFSIPGGSMTKTYADKVYSGVYEGLKYENKGIVLLYGSRPTESPISKELDLKKISRVRVRGNEKLNNDFEYWINYFDEHPDEKYVSDGNLKRFVINKDDDVNVSENYSVVIK